MSKSQTKTNPSTTPSKEVSRSLIKQAGQSYTFSWSWFLGGIIVITLLCLSTYGMRTFNMFNMSQQIIDISEGLEKEGNLRGAIDVLASFLESYPNNPEVWKRQCDLWNELYQSQRMVSRDMLPRAIDRQKRAIPFLKEESVREVRERILAMELEMAKSDIRFWPDTITNARELLQLWENHPLAKKVLAMGVWQQFQATELRPAVEDLPLDTELFQAAWSLNHGDIDLAVDYATFLRSIQPGWQNVVSPTLLARDPDARNTDADEIINTMVRENSDNAAAYLTRYRYKLDNKLLDFSRLDLDPDLAKALEYSPDAPLALQYAGQQMIVSAQFARSQGKIQEADENQNRSYEYFSKAIAANPINPEGYLLLSRWYMISNQPDQALRTLNEGRQRIVSVAPDILGEIAYISIDRKLYDQARGALIELERFVNTVGPSLRGTRRENLNRTYGLLLGKLYLAQRDDALTQAVEANRQIEESHAKNIPINPNLQKQAEDNNSIAEYFRNQAVNEIRTRLDSLADVDYDFSGSSLLSRLQGEGFISLGRLEAELQAWDRAVDAYNKARIFPAVAPLATIQAANVYERANQFDNSLATLQDGARRFPDNPTLRFFYLNALFARELAKSEPSTRNYALVENELNEVAQFQEKLPQPWRVDTMRVQLQYVRGGGTRQVQQECLAKLRELEGNAKYAEDLLFYAEITSQYSSMGAFDDFNRAIYLIRDMPGGETRYYLLRIEDARRRGDTTAALFLADEAASVVPEAERLRFVRIREVIENPGAAGFLDPDEEYDRLKNLYDGQRIHDPHTFFELANLAFSRGEVEIAKNIEDRLKQIEGEQTGTLWRYLAVRRLIRQAGGDPNSELLNNARTIQREIAGMRPNWDMTHVLRAEIEKESGDTNEAIIAYQAAVARGSRQPMVYRDLISLLYQVGRDGEGERMRRIAAGIFGPAFFGSDNIFPPAYQGFYEQIYRAIQEGNIGSADDLANACIRRAIENQEPTDLILDLNMRIGKLFVDSSNEASAERFLAAVAEQGGKFVFPLAICYIKMGKTDEGFELFVRELERSTVDPSILVPLLLLSTQARPAEAVFQRIDRQLERLEPIFIETMETLVQLADYWINRDRIDNAIPIYRKGLEMDPNNLLILNNLAMLLAENARGGGVSILARGEFRENEAKRILLTTPQPRSTYIIRFSAGQTTPNPEDFRFLTTPRE